MPGTDSDHDDDLSLPPSVKEREFIEAALPLLIRLASESAAATTRSAAAQASVEVRMGEMKVAIERCTDITARAQVALDRQSVALEADHRLATEEIKLRQEGRTQFFATVRSVFTPQVVTPLLLQVLTMIGLAFGFYSQMGPMMQDASTQGHAESRAPQPSGGGSSSGVLSTDGNDP